MADASVVATQPRDKDFGKSKYGCEHYRRRCRIRAPCCDQVFTCRHCHNEATSSLSNPEDHHELDRHKIKRVICAVCDTEQEVSQVCFNCGVNMAEYYCDICKFFDDETEKKQFHCDECGICRVGGRDNFFHCPTCGSCYTITLRNNHQCIENSMKNQCPVCYEYLFDSVKGAVILKCGHTIHRDCFDEMTTKNQYRCPLCFKAALNMSEDWKLLDEEIAAIPMPEEYRMEVSILCNDCNTAGKAPFHVFGLKCSRCGSYNTRRISDVGENDVAAVPSEQEHQD